MGRLGIQWVGRARSWLVLVSSRFLVRAVGWYVLIIMPHTPAANGSCTCPGFQNSFKMGGETVGTENICIQTDSFWFKKVQVSVVMSHKSSISIGSKWKFHFPNVETGNPKSDGVVTLSYATVATQTRCYFQLLYWFPNMLKSLDEIMLITD